MVAYALALSAAFLPTQPGEAELLLRKMDETITAAKTLRIELKLDSSAAVLVLGDRNRFRLELWADDPDRLTILVGDGKRVSEIGPGKAAPEFRPQPAWYTEVLRSWLGRGGTMRAVFETDHRAREAGGKKPGPGHEPRLSNIRMVSDEEVNGVKCRVIDYDLTWRNGALDSRDQPVRVWIDPKASLPVRRVMTLRGNNLRGEPWAMTVTATHTWFDLDPKLDDALFDLPGEVDLFLAQMDARINCAKTLRIEFEITAAKPDPSSFPLHGTLVLGDRNRFRFEWRTAGGRPDLTVGDGKRTGRKVGLAKNVPEFRAQPDWHNHVLRSWLGRGGTLLSAQTMGYLQAGYLKTADGRTPGRGVGPVASKARLLPDEEVNGVKARVVEYELSWRGLLDTNPRADRPKPVKVRVWIDPRSKLPLRRSMGDGPDTYTATHTKFELDPKLDDTVFELPR